MKQFRVWDSLAKKMYYGNEFLLDGWAGQLILNPCQQGFTKRYKELSKKHNVDLDSRITPLFSTGPKDKKNLLIFEGDILQKYGYGSEKCISMGETYGLSWYEVIFRNGGFIKCWRKSENNFYASKASFNINFMLDDYHVVGNLYENPELLLTTTKQK